MSTPEPRRDWLSIGDAALAEGSEHEVNDGGEWRVEQRPITRAQVAQVIESLKWRAPAGSFPMSPGLALQECIRELGLPKVTLVAYNGGPFNDGGYTLMGIEANYRDARVRLYVMDRGHDCVPICCDVWLVKP